MSGDHVIGLMDSAYFVSKNELLKWINQTLKLQLTFIEDLGSGAVYCQLIDAFHRNVVPMAKLNWRAKFEYEFLNNLKIFQMALEKISAPRKFDMTRLAKARSQDNLQTIQWLKRYLELGGSPLPNYDPVARRNNEQLYSYHAQKNSFINKPAKTPLNATQQNFSSFHSPRKRDSLQPHQGEKLDRIRRVLGSKQPSQTKLCLITEIVSGPKASRMAIQKENNGIHGEEEIY